MSPQCEAIAKRGKCDCAVYDQEYYMEDKGHNYPDLKLLRFHLMQVLDTAISDIDKLKSVQKRETKKSLRKQCFVSMTCEQMLKEIGVFISFSKEREWSFDCGKAC